MCSAQWHLFDFFRFRPHARTNGRVETPQKLLRILDHVRGRADRYYLRSGGFRDPTDVDAARWERLRAELARRGHGSIDRWETPPLREADHVVPVVEGGGCCGLENYRTLCIPCHRAQTRGLRGRMRRAGIRGARGLPPSRS